MTMEERVRLFAYAAHAAVGQKRKYSNEPYIVHPMAVAELVRSVPHTEEMIAAALLHDVVEDTKITFDVITGEFGLIVSDLVFWLTDISGPEDGNREVRKARNRAHIAKAPAAAKTIKVADIIDNSRSIFEHDPNFAKVYCCEIELLMDVLQEADPALIKIAKLQLEEYTGIIH